jgi:hypothetical protein
MSILDTAKIVWRWGSLVPQIADDYRYHRRVQGLDTHFLHRFLEQLALLWSNRVTAVDYYNLGLFDPNMPAAEKRCYIGGYELWRIFQAFNPREYHQLTVKKLQFNAYAAEANLPIARVLAVVTTQPTDHRFPSLATEEELGAWMTENSVHDVVLKPVDGTKGWGVLSLSERIGQTNRWKKLPGSETIDLAALWAHCARYLYRGGVIIQRRLLPHPVLAKLMPNVLHTVRVVTYIDPQPVIIDAVLRVGSGKGPADNFAQGGIVVHVDLATGRCGQGTTLVDGLPRTIDDHPVSGSRITDIQLPDWDQVCDLAKVAAQRFSMQKSIGWDVGLTDQGPVLLEGNWCYDLAVNQIANRTGILATRWVEAFDQVGAYRHLGLGFINRPR